MHVGSVVGECGGPKGIHVPEGGPNGVLAHNAEQVMQDLCVHLEARLVETVCRATGTLASGPLTQEGLQDSKQAVQHPDAHLAAWQNRHNQASKLSYADLPKHGHNLSMGIGWDASWLVDDSTLACGREWHSQSRLTRHHSKNLIDELHVVCLVELCGDIAALKHHQELQQQIQPCTPQSSLTHTRM